MRKFIVLTCLGLLGLTAALAVSPTAGAGCTTVFGVQVCGEDIPDGPAVTLCTDEASCNAGEGPPEDPPESTDQEEPAGDGETTTAPDSPDSPPVGTVSTATTSTAKPTVPAVVVEPDICTNYPGMKSFPGSRWFKRDDGTCDVRNPNADVAVTEQSDRSVAHVGEIITFTLTVTNNGEGEAPYVGLSKPIPKGLELLTPNDVTWSNGNCSVTGGVGSQVVRCEFPMIDLNERVTVTIRVKATSVGNTSSLVEVGTDKRADQNMGNNRDSEAVNVVAPATKPSGSAPPALKPKTNSKALDRTGVITVRTPGYDKLVSFRVNVYVNAGGVKRQLFQDRIWNNNPITFKLPPGATSQVKFNGAKRAGWNLIGTNVGPLNWVYTATRVSTPTAQESKPVPATSTPQLRKPGAQFVWVSMNLIGPDGTKKCGVYVSLNFYPDKGGVAHVGSRTTCTVTKLKYGQSGNLCQVVRKGVKAISPVCVRINRPGRLIQFNNAG
jgi:uncharacterized repeat protein (TIGR01451 family)